MTGSGSSYIQGLGNHKIGKKSLSDYLKSFDRIVITGANGAGKTSLARAVAGNKPLIHLDALKLTTDWSLRPVPETRADLENRMSVKTWVIEGGPSLLSPEVLECADLVIWLDPSVVRRAWQLAKRVLNARGKTRPELPEGNPDYFLPQLKFALKSLLRQRAFDAEIVKQLAPLDMVPCVRVRNVRELSVKLDAMNVCPP